MNPSPAMSQKWHGVQAKRLNLHKTMQKPHKLATHVGDVRKQKLVKPKIQKKTKENQTNIKDDKQIKFLGFQPHPWIWVYFFVFPKVFTKQKIIR